MAPTKDVIVTTSVTRGLGCLVACLALTGTAGAEINLEEAVTVFDGDLSTATMPQIQGGTDQTYVLAIATEENDDVTGVVDTLAELTWVEQKEQCALGEASGIRLWTAQGSPSGPFQVQITHPTAGMDLTAVLARYSGVLSIEDATGENTAGENDTTCAGPTKSNTAQLTLTSTQNRSVHVIGVCPKQSFINSISSGYSEIDKRQQGRAYTFLYERAFDTATTDQFQATINGAAQKWSTAGVVLNPIPATYYRSIGTWAPPVHDEGTASITAGTSTASFSGTTLPLYIGQGDKLTVGSGGPATLFSDPFGDGSNNGWTSIGLEDNMSDTGGHFEVDSADSSSHYTIDAGAGWTDYTFTVDINNDDDDFMGILARVQDVDNYYYLRQSFGDTQGQGADGWWLRLRKVVGGTETDLGAVDNQGTNPGQVDGTGTYQVKLEVTGTSLKAWVDGVLKFDVTDSEFASGPAGIWVFSQGNNSWFDNALVQTADDGVYHILSRDDDTTVTIQEIAGASRTGETYTIERVYDSMQAWENGRGGDLVTEARREVGVCYNDAPFTDRLVVSGSTTDAAHYMMITVAAGQRHNGLKGNGAVIDAQGGWLGQNAIDIEDEYTVIDGLEIKAIQDAGSAIFFDDSPAADNSLASNIFVHSCWQNSNAGVDIGAQNVTVRNSIFTGGTSYGVRLLTNSSGIIENCTIVGSPGSGHGVGDQIGTTVTIRNTISVNHDSGYDFVLYSNIDYFGYNMYEPAFVIGFDPATCPSCAGGNQTPPGNLESLFVSMAASDYHLEPSGHKAGNTGLNLASVTDDVDGETRTGTWDMGADEGVPGTDPPSPTIISWQEVEP
ncbi:MAG: right-handed parallel beta-helix repeat-containing protein [Planctomycetota bacterium]